ncbi:MAG: 30S ribosomal protein S20 [Spirochaetes bacterium]|nr:30S ribosomal protein S20 [Spirochaetota bacterium]
MASTVVKQFHSAEKRHTQDEKRRIQNKKIKTGIRGAAKKVLSAVLEKNKAKADETLKTMIKEIDTAARKGIVKKNAAARKKSRLQHLVNTLLA